MKTLTSIGFVCLSLLFLLQAGNSWVLIIQKEKQKAEIRQKLFEGFLSDELILLEIPIELEKSNNTMFRRIHDREFMYLGQMYDIVRQERIGHSTWYEVFPDKKETKLKQLFKQMLQDETQRKGPVPLERLAQQALVLFWDETGASSLLQQRSVLSQQLATYFFIVKEFLTSVPEQPPRYY